eukprot:4193810-Pyramimonas_sp.AAC.1
MFDQCKGCLMHAAVASCAWERAKFASVEVGRQYLQRRTGFNWHKDSDLEAILFRLFRTKFASYQIS